MATNLVNYIGNLGKSVGYSTVEKFKTMAPSTTEFISTNSELYKNVYENIRDYKTTYKKSSEALRRNKIYEAAHVGITAIFEDISSGKLYNRERQESMEARALGMDNPSGGDDWGSFEIDDSAFDIGDDDDFGDFSEGEKKIVQSVEATSRSNANAVSMAVARTGEYVVESNKEQTNLLFTQNMHAYGNMTNVVSTLNDNVGKILEFSNGVTKTHAENSQKFYEQTTEFMKTQTALLTRIANVVAPEQKQKEQKEKIGYDDIVGANGTPNISMYFKEVNKNIKDVMGKYIPNMNITGDENANPYLALVAQPLSFIPNYIVSKMIPDTVQKSIEGMDASLSGLFGSLMTKFNGMSKDEDGSFISKIIGKIFGIKNGLKSDIDPSVYEKGKVDWDGRSKKALEEVIPTYLARIESLISGKSEKRFDYSTGKFMVARDIKDKFDKEKERFSKSSYDDLRSLFDEYMENMTFNSKGEKEGLEKDINKIFDYMYKNNKLFDVNNENFDDLYSEYGVDSKNLRLFRAMFRQAPNSLKMQLSSNIMSARQKQTNTLEKYQNEGSIYNNIFNDLPIDEFVNYNKNTEEETSLGLLGNRNLLTELKDNLGHTVYYYLQNINRELTFIRKGGIGNTADITPDNKTIIYANGKEVEIEDKKYKFEDEKIEDKSEISAARKYADEKRREQESYVNREKRRREKNKSLFNVSEFKGEDKDYENRLKSILETKEVEKQIRKSQEKEKKKKDGFIDSLLSESTLGGKMNKFIEKGQNILSKPMDFVANIFNRADQRMYEMIYGTETGEEGFMSLFKRKTLETFSNINGWIDEHILEPLKKKLDVDSFKDLTKKFFNLFGIDIEDTGKRIRGYFFGDKETGEKGLLSDIKDGFKDTFGGVWDGVKNSVKETFGDITKPFREKFKNRKKVFKERAENEDEETLHDAPDTTSSPKSNVTQTADIIDNIYKSRYEHSGATVEDYTSMFDLLNGEDFNYDEQIEKIREEMRENTRKFNERRGDAENFLDNKGNKRFARKFLKDKKSLMKEIEDLKSRKDNMLKTIEERYSYDQDSIDFKDMLETIGLDTNNMNLFDMETLRKRIPDMKDAGIDDLIDAINSIDGLKNNIDLVQEYKDKALKSEATGDDKITLSEIQKFKYEKEEDRKDPDYFIHEFKELIDKSKEDAVESEIPQIESRNYLKEIRDFLLGLRPGTASAPVPVVPNTPVVPTVEPDRDQQEDQVLRTQAGDLANVILNFLQGNTSQHATGSNVLEKAEVATLKPGELVLNPDEVKSVSSLVDSLAKALGTAGNKLSDISADNYKKFTKLKDKFGDRFNIDNMEDYMSDKTKEKYASVIDLDQYRKVVNDMCKQYEIDNDLDENGEPKDPIQKALYKDVKPFVTLMGEEASSAFRSVRKSLFGISPEDENKRFTEMMEDISENVSEYAPKAIPAAVLGSGVSLITGAIGGPLLGAAIGAGSSLVMNSEKAQKWLFGEKIADERTGGVIPKSVIDSVSKYVPQMSKYGLTGALAGLLTPLGPVGGLLIGSAAGFAKKNDDIQNMLFGEEGLFDEKSKEKLDKMLPRMGLGVLAGTMFGPFGILGNAILGAGAGYLTTSNRFTEVIMGKYNEKTDRYENGILPALRESIVDPLSNFGGDIKNKFMEFIEHDMIDPLKRAMDPLKTDAKLLINGMGRIVGRSLDWLFERSFGLPLSKLANSVTKYASGFAKGLTGKLLAPIGKFAASLPFKTAGLIGDIRRNAQINQGNARYMTAEERLAMKGDRDYKYRKLDEFIAGGDGNLEGMENLSESISKFKDLNKSDVKKRKELARETGDEVIKHFGYRDSSAIQKSFRDGDYDKIDEIVSKSTVDRKADLIKILKNSQKEYSSKMKKLMEKADKNKWNEYEINYKETHIRDDIKKSYLRHLDSNTQKEILDKLREDFDNPRKDRGEDYVDFETMMKNKIKDNDNNTKELTDFINGQKEKFDNFKKNKTNKATVIENLQKEMLDRGVNIDLSDEKELDKVQNMIQKEIETLKLLRDRAEYDEDLELTDAEKEKLKDTKLDKQHEEIVDLFAQAITALNNLNKSKDEETKPKTGNTTEETIENLKEETEKQKDSETAKSKSQETNLDAVTKQLEQINQNTKSENSTSEDGIVTKVENGKVYQYKKEKNGDLSPNLSDAQTRNNISEDKAEREERKGFFSKFGNLFGKKNKETADGENGEKKESLWEKIKKMFTTAAPIAKIVGGLLSTGAAGMFIKKMLSDSDFKEKVGEKIKEVLFPEFGDDGDGKDGSTNSITSNGIVRDVLKGGKGLAKISAKTALKGKDILNPVKGIAKLGIHGTSSIGSFLGKGISKATGVIDNMGILRKAREKISGNIAKITNPFVNDVTKNVAEAVEKGAAGELSEKLSKFLYKLFENRAVKKLVGENAENIAQKFVPKFVEKITRKAAENSAKLASRMAAIATTGGLMSVAFFVGDFVSGYRDAKNILGVTHEDIQELGFFYKLAAGILKAVNNAFLITSFIPEEFYISAIFDYLAPAVGISDTDIQQRRKNAQDELKRYNEEHNTDLSLREYNKEQDANRPGIIDKAKSWVGDKVSKVTDWVGNTSIGKKATELKNWVTGDENFQKAYNILDNVGSYVLPHRLIKEHIFKKKDEGEAEGGPINDEPIGGGEEINVNDFKPSFINHDNSGYNNINMGGPSDNSLLDRLRIGKPKVTSNDNIIIYSIVSNAKNVCMDVLNNTTVQTLISSEKARELANKFVPSFGKFLLNNISSSNSISNKNLAAMMNGGTLDRVSAVQDFISGYNDAQSILALTSEPTVGLKVCAGMIKVYSRFISISGISSERYIEFVNETILPIFKSIDIELAKNRQQLNNSGQVSNSLPIDTTTEFENQNINTDNSGKGIIQKAKENVVDMYNTVKEKASNAWSNVKETASNVWSNVKEKASNTWSNVKQTASNLYTSAKSAFSNFKSKLGFGGPYKEQDWSDFDMFDNTKNKVKSKMENIFDGMGGQINGITTGTEPLSADVNKYSSIFESAAQKYGIDPAWIKAISMQESGGNVNSDNGAALGIMQIEKGGTTDEFIKFGKDLGEKWTANDRRDPNKAIPFGANRLKFLLDHYNGDYAKATQAYNFSHYSLDALLKAFPDNWMDHRKEVGQYNGTGLANYGDPKYVEHVFRYYTGDGQWSGGSGTGTTEDTKSTNSGLISELGNLFKNTVGKAFGIDLTGESSSGVNDGTSTVNGGSAFQNGSVDTSSLSGTAKVVVDAAASMIGCPYVWSGTGEPLTEATVNKYRGTSHDITSNDGANNGYKAWIGKPGFDCSGLMQYAYNKANISIGRDTNAQLASKAGTEISVSEVQPGDLIFFGSRSNNHHVGMAIGNGKMIEAPSSGKTVRVADIRKDAFAAKRFIKSGQGGIFDQYRKQMKVYKAENDIVNNGLGGPVDTFFSKSLNGNVTSNFGFRNTRGTIGRNHTGIDIGAKQGTDIKSPIGGVVTKKVDSSKSNGYGNLVVMKDQQGAEHYFGHMENPTNLKPGDTVKPGQKLGNVGNTGNSTGSHLHYEVKQGGMSIDPNKYYRNKGIGGEKDTNKVERRKEYSTSKSSNNIELIKSIITILSKIAQNTVSVNDIFKLLQGNLGQNKSETTKSADNSTASNELKMKQNQQDTAAFLKGLTGNKNDLGEQDLLNLVTALAQM